MDSFWVIRRLAWNTLREAVRDRVLYILLAFSFLFVLLGFTLGQLSYEEVFRLSVSLGLGGIHFCFSGLTLFLGCSLFYREMERKTIYSLLARPITRNQYIWGKYLGLMSVLYLLLLGFCLIFFFVEGFLGFSLSLGTLYIFLGFFLEAWILLSVAFFFSSFLSPFVSIFSSILFFIIGHWMPGLENLMKDKGASSLFKYTGSVILSVFPNLEIFNWRYLAIDGSSLWWGELVLALAMAFVWSLFFLTFSMIFFQRRDIV